ncbi:hypothetical protein BDV38DRAFT_154532 [Aspergillus pseudotamarii]|uniref:GPI anchored protein n=1 Tax=Aspergillus pseudotamarii TaxID=132259 RepID=A0A5N6SJD7_ASPPS|nr:uncharacterized protein BDV38DRAFT_154532 [Aspergillus pseudotamarii]KAE8134755.1 hypothetical protein BDV38DRAFT_154532 [Aspergillus pseudotamarii]
MKGLQNGIPIAMLAAMASAQGFGGGPRVDTGNGVGMGFSNDFSNEVNNVNKDDHATNVHSETNILKAPPHPPHGGPHGRPHGGHDGHNEGGRHQPRAGHPGSDGVDVGTAAQWNSVNEAKHEVHSANVDNHHVDINEKHTITVLPPPPKHHPHGGEHEGHGEEHQHGHEQGEGGRGHGKRYEGGAIDSGNSANYDFENMFHSKTNNANLDDHSVDVDQKTNIVTPPPHPHGHGHEHERRDEHEPRGGPKIDTGNDVDFTFSNKFNHEVNSYNQDNHGVDVNKNTNVQVAPPHGGPPHGHEGQEGHHKRAYRPDADDAGRVDIGNAANSEASNSVDAKTNSANVDDHSMSLDYNVNETVAPPHADHHDNGHEQPAEHHQQEPAKPVEHHEEEHAEPAPTCTTLTREVVHTVVRTVQAHSEPTHGPQHQEQVNTPAPQHEQPKDHQGTDHDDHSEVKSPKPTGDDGSHNEVAHGPASTPAHEQPKPTGVDGSHHEEAHGPASTPAQEQPKPTGVDGSHNEVAHGPASTPAHEQPKPTGVDGSHHEEAHGPASTPAQEQPKPTGADNSHRKEDPSSHEGAHSTNAHGPASTPVHGQPQHVSDGSHFDVPSSTTLAHIGMTPAPTHAPSNQHGVLTSTQTIRPSSSHMVHVYVPQGSSSAAHVGQTPAATPSAHVPVGVDAEHSSHVANSPPTPTPSSHDVMFTGAAANLSPSAGVISLACGVIGLLAYVL